MGLHGETDYAVVHAPRALLNHIVPDRCPPAIGNIDLPRGVAVHTGNDVASERVLLCPAFEAVGLVDASTNAGAA